MTAQDIKRSLENGRLLEVQVQLAAELGHEGARGVGLPRLPLRRHWLQWLLGIHRGLPGAVQRVLRSATREPRFALAPIVSVRWACECLGRVVDAHDALKDPDSPAAAALAAARQILAGTAVPERCEEAALAANAAIAPAADERLSAAYYSARESLQAAAMLLRAPSLDWPHWMVCDTTANHAGHAARHAARAAGDRPEDFDWQRQRLAELVLESVASEWDSADRDSL
ncbi:MAG: hypothetical protein FD126_1257 [Elusimicrobia bacterium]|nr:MAG: hypothetical protein FD126_1257 [Elusimicrobiota bacterium]